MLTWRLLLPPMLQWMTKGLAAGGRLLQLRAGQGAAARGGAGQGAPGPRAQAGPEDRQEKDEEDAEASKPPIKTATKHKTPAPG